MSIRALRLRAASVVALLLFASVLSCGREVTGPGGRGRLAEVALNPVFGTLRLAGSGEARSVASVVTFTRVRVVLVRVSGDTAVDRVVEFPADSTSVRLSVTVALGTGATSDGEPFAATLKYVNAAGDTVFTGGPVTVTAVPGGSGGNAPPPEIPVVYTGRGANAASVTIAPKNPSLARNQTLTFSATVRDAAQAVITGVPVAYTSSDTSLVRVDLASGAATVPGIRGTARVTVQTLTGQLDSTTVTITPTPTAIAVASGNNQSVRQGSAFPLPVRVRVTAADALPVAGAVVAFAVTSGQGSASPALDTTDANGVAETNWAAGDSAGVATLRASVQGTSLTATATGTQLSSAPTTLTFETQPTNIAAGQPLPTIRLVVRDATADTVRSFNGNVTLSLTGAIGGLSAPGAAIASNGGDLVGVTTVAAVNGVVRWDSLTVNKAGTAYRLSAAIAGGPSASSNTFNASASLPAAIAVDAGDNQTVLPGVAYPDSLVARVTDVFGAPKSGVTVAWAVLAGGGTVSPATSVTDVNGRARAQWTAGTGGAQQLRASVSGLVPATFNATVIAVDGPPVLFVTADVLMPGIGRTLPVTIFLSNPTPAPLPITLTMLDTVAAWGTTSVTIPAGGTQVTASVRGVTQGATVGVVSSSVGTDSVQINVTPSLASIAGGPWFYLAVGDTVRTRVVLGAPAPAGGLTVTVRSLDSAAVRVAPGSGLGVQEDDCGFYSCGNESLRAEAAPDATLLAPPAGTATITIPAGQFVGHLVILPVAATPQTAGILTIEAADLISPPANVFVSDAAAYAACQWCASAPGHVDGIFPGLSDALRRDMTLRLRSLDPAIVTVRDSVGVISAKENYADDVLRVVAVDTGTARLVASGVGVRPDTLLYRVWPRGLLMDTYSGSFLEQGTTATRDVFLGRIESFGFAAGPGVDQPVTVSLVSRDTSVVRLDRGTLQVASGSYTGTMRYTGGAPGSTYIVASAPGYPTDSGLVTVAAPAIYLYAGGTDLGVGSRSEDFYVQVSNYAQGSAVPVTISSSDPNIVRVLTPSPVIPAGQTYTYASLEGRAAGTATLTVSAPGRQPVTITKTVIPSSLIFSSFAFDTPLDVTGQPSDVVVLAGVSPGTFNVAQQVADTVRAVLRSTNPAVLQVTDSAVTIAPGSYYSSGGAVQALAEGVAQLTISAAGRQSDTSAFITVLPPRLVAPLITTTGIGGRAEIGLVRASTPTASLPVSLTLRSSVGSTLAQPSATFAAGSSSTTVVVLAGTAVGTDTLIVSAAGHLPDTTLIQVLPEVVTLDIGSVPLGPVDSITAYLSDVQYAGFAAGSVRRYRVTSSDTTIIKVTADTLAWAPGDTAASRRIAVYGRRPGYAFLLATPLGDTTVAGIASVEVAAPRLYQPNFGTLSLGMGTRTSLGEQYIERTLATDTPVWVRLTSSAPTVVIVPDSILIPAGETAAPYRIAAGDTVGSAIITFSARGHEGGTLPVTVTRSTFGAYVPNQPSVGTTSSVEVYALDNSYIARERRAATPLRLSASDTTVLQVLRDTTSIPAGSAYTFLPAAIAGRKPGTTPVSIVDRRTGFAAISPLGTTLEVVRNRLVLPSVRFDVAAGALASPWAFVEAAQPVDSIWVRVRTLNGRAAVVEDSVKLRAINENLVALGLRGVSVGTDTVVVSAQGFDPDTAVVRVTAGYFGSELPLPAAIRQGDSVAVTLVLYSPDGYAVAAGPAPIPLTFTTPANLDVRLGGATVTTASFPAGASSFTVYLRGIAPGSGTVTVSSPNVTSASASISTRAP